MESPKAPTFIYNSVFETEGLVLLATDFSAEGEARIYAYTPEGTALTPATPNKGGTHVDRRGGVSFSTLFLLVVGFFSNGAKAESMKLIIAGAKLSHAEALRLDGWLTHLREVGYDKKFPQQVAA